ncbi:MAG TPA: phosphate signaling complex protein PhoU [Azospirillaceae bacterium]|nr:phosphate signaling complex protein PhoU [Azospirillaceae bacterium]
MAAEHTVKAFEQELRRLTNRISQMGGYAEAQIADAVQALVRRDTALAERIVQADARLDGYEREVEHDAVRVLALRQPMGSDLREVLAALKISADLERSGDYAANIAKRSVALAKLPAVAPAAAIPRMGSLVRDMLRDVLDAYVDRDVEKAVTAWRRDAELDGLYTDLFREALAHMAADTDSIAACTHLLFIAKNLERVGDHATNIAETIHFLVRGQPISGTRPKDDRTCFETMPHAASGRAATP